MFPGFRYPESGGRIAAAAGGKGMKVAVYTNPG